jgi:hypothetical protein
MAVAESGETNETRAGTRGRDPMDASQRLARATSALQAAKATRYAYCVSMYSRTATILPSRTVKTPMQKFS